MTDPKPPIITGEGIEDPTEMQDEPEPNTEGDF